jgi:hypothetical protein
MLVTRIRFIDSVTMVKYTTIKLPCRRNNYEYNTSYCVRQNLINSVPSDATKTSISNFPKRTSVRDMHKAFHMPYVYDYITQLCRQQAEVIQNHENENVRYIGQGEARHRKYKRLKCV